MKPTQQQRVIVTGHTGFKGSWLCHLLKRRGAHVTGVSIDVPGEQHASFHALKIADRVDSNILDINNGQAVSDVFARAEPDVVFHLAAQSLVRPSYDDPIGTWATNVMGTANVLQAATQLAKPVVLIIVTTDKVYKNLEWHYAYRETDTLGGHDPYSSSKAAAEILVSSWRASFQQRNPNLRIATARAGNVIGGGDFAADRLIPDMVRAWQANKSVEIRNPASTRPWQHVLEALSGYTTLADRLREDSSDHYDCFNFGPNADDVLSVGDMVQEAAQLWPGALWHSHVEGSPPHEARSLTLTSEKAAAVLGWKPRWNAQAAIKHTLTWYREAFSGRNCIELTDSQIEEYESHAF